MPAIGLLSQSPPNSEPLAAESEAEALLMLGDRG